MRKRTLITAVALTLGLSFTAPAVWADEHGGEAEAGQEASDKKDESAGDEGAGGCGGSSEGSSEQSSEGSH